MPPAGVISDEELDAEETQDEILARSGVYNLPHGSAIVWETLVVLGVVVMVLGFLFWYGIAGIHLPAVDFPGVALGLSLAVLLVILGVIALVAGIALYGRHRRDPYEMKPIR